MEHASLTALADLLSHGSHSSGNDDSRPPAAAPSLGPGSLGNPHSGGLVKAGSAPRNPRLSNAKKAVKKEIWDLDDVEENLADACDPRAQPQYDILYRHAIGTEETYLGLDPLKNFSSSACQSLVVKVRLPETKLEEIDLDVQSQQLTVRSPKFKLVLGLQLGVDEKNGNAKWQSHDSTLVVTLPVKPIWEK